VNTIHTKKKEENLEKHQIFLTPRSNTLDFFQLLNNQPNI